MLFYILYVFIILIFVNYFCNIKNKIFDCINDEVYFVEDVIVYDVDIICKF